VHDVIRSRHHHSRVSAGPVAGVAVFLALSLSLTVCSSNAHADTEGVGEPGPERDRPANEPTDRSDEDTEALRIGAIAGIGFPHPLAVEAVVKVEGVLALGLEYSALPTTTIMGVSTSGWAIAGDVRLFPLRNGSSSACAAGDRC
jgi:hypothetical protein